MKTRLRDLREDRDLTQAQIADFLHIHQTTYSSYERGELNVPLHSLCALAEFYNTSTDYILGRTNVDRPYPFKQGSVGTGIPLGHQNRHNGDDSNRSK